MRPRRWPGGRRRRPSASWRRSTQPGSSCTRHRRRRNPTSRKWTWTDGETMLGRFPWLALTTPPFLCRHPQAAQHPGGGGRGRARVSPAVALTSAGRLLYEYMLILVVKCLTETSCFLPLTVQAADATGGQRGRPRGDQSDGETRGRGPARRVSSENMTQEQHRCALVESAPSTSLLFFPSRETTEAEPPSERRDLESPGTPAGEDLGDSSKPQVRHSRCTLIGCSDSSDDTHALFPVCLRLVQAAAAGQDGGGGENRLS